jgi:AraC family transcriptional regulator, regulatory protein of adaptative response / methylated-DNA-[protein]-cysteine methyltransferase
MNTSARSAILGPVVGVRTTRIYCRPVCRPGRAPRRENCVPFLSASVARAAGFRPCKQCRPDAERAALTIRYGMGETPLGFAFVATTDRGICGLYLIDSEDAAPGLVRLRTEFPDAEIFEDLAAVELILSRLCGYLNAGDPCSDLALDPRGTTFQRRVWEALREIPRGETWTYGELAARLGLPGAARAVGAACGANPVSVLIPCHRVVRAGGAMGGNYWGLDRKRALLDLERKR